MADESNYWKSLRELQKDSSLTEKDAGEFMSGVADDFNPSELSGMSRKQFLALLAASAAFAAAGCSDYRDKGEIVPYTKKPEEVTPGVPNYYASTCTACPQVCGILIKTREGRPIKIDGNPDHPISRGKICAKGQASILNLYDPYRLRSPQYGSASGKNGILNWNHANAEVIRRLEEAVKTGKEIAIVSRAIQSPTTKNVLDEFKKKYPTTALYSYSLLNNETAKRAWQKCYGTVDLPVIQWDKAKVILALESDFLGTDGMTIEQIRKFTEGRDILKSKNFNRLYCVEGMMSLTGANADYRLRLRPDAYLELVFALISEFDKKIGQSNVSLKEFSEKYNVSFTVLQHLIDDMRQHRGEAIVLAGEILSESIHIAVNYLNEILGSTKLFAKDQTSKTIVPLSTFEELNGLIVRMKGGRVGVILHLDSNPVYQLPGEYDFENALKSAPFSVSLTEADNETSRVCTLTLPINHAFESWGDHKVRTGLLSLQQPVIAPLYDTREKEAILLSWTDKKDSSLDNIYHEYIMSRWEKEVYPALQLKVDFRTFWYASLHDGVVEFIEPRENNLKFKFPSVASISIPESHGYILAITEDHYLGDGSFANNGWLQELPHPISKIVWDNYAAISPQTAQELGLGNNDLLRIELPQGSAVVPVFLQPGQADKFLSISFGYGRTCAGPVGTDVGTDIRQLFSKQSISDSRIFTDVKISKAEGSHELVSTQEHHSLNDEFVKDLHLKRKIIREGTLAEYEKNSNFLHEGKEKLFSITQEIEYKGVKWAMAIDLNRCIGCNACAAGCNVENNIPVVGKEQVAKGRAMHWIRIDRYYSGNDAEPSLSHQPMLCQQCDNAPCENVCPVVATNHSPDGLNQMVYNRCVGTKYCSNNCPYKVRRFNFFNWRNHLADGYYEQQPIQLLQNPEVTVRSRGVMEKCTFCVQRIMEARQHAIEQGRALKGSDVKTACQEACPATAIVFGDMNDPNSEVTQYRNHHLGYHVLEELNVRPNVTYIAKLRNT
jgi:MoCo/4Fe-4S cofactor protein with predicted Tat translocation signal